MFRRIHCGASEVRNSGTTQKDVGTHNRAVFEYHRLVENHYGT